jgi:hypothetical protein
VAGEPTLKALLKISCLAGSPTFAALHNLISVAMNFLLFCCDAAINTLALLRVNQKRGKQVKNFVIIGDLWKRVIEFVSEANADAYIANNCPGVCCEKCSEAEFEERFARVSKKSLEYGLNEYNALRLIILGEDS